MRQLKGTIQDAADRINDPMVDDNISAIKAMVVIDKNIQEAIKAHDERNEQISAQNNKQNTIVRQRYTRCNEP